MTSKELVLKTIMGETVPRFSSGPLAVHYTAALSGVSLRQYTLSAQVMADCITRYYELCQPDAIWVSADTWVTAEAMGSRVGFVDEHSPLGGIGEPLVRTACDIERIPEPQPDAQGRMPLIRQALTTVKQRLGDGVFVVGCFDQSPFSLACALMGINELMVKLVDDAPFVQALLQRCIDYAVAYGLYLADGGADMLSTGDSPAGLIGPTLYRRFALPAEKTVFEEIRRRGNTLLSLHICGQVDDILADMAGTGCDVLEIDHKTDLQKALNTVPKNVALWGNLDPVATLEQADVDQVLHAAADVLRQVREQSRTRFVLSSGCTLTQATPIENVRAMVSAAKTSAVYFRSRTD